jgi:hypothetical protein
MDTVLKALQVEEKVLQVQKTTRQALLEPLQGKVEQLVMESDTTKKSIEKIVSKEGEILQSPMIDQVVTAMVDKRSQAQQQCQRIMKMYDALQLEVSEAGSKK